MAKPIVGITTYVEPASWGHWGQVEAALIPYSYVRAVERAGGRAVLVPPDDDELLLWGIFTRFDCARDLIPATTETRGAWTVCRGPLGIDATWKEGYPEPVASPPEVVAKVDAWWAPESRG